jgi:hypothetical protein
MLPSEKKKVCNMLRMRSILLSVWLNLSDNFFHVSAQFCSKIVVIRTGDLNDFCLGRHAESLGRPLQQNSSCNVQVAVAEPFIFHFAYCGPMRK